MKRNHGEEQPHIKLTKSGLFKLRVPFIHWRFAFPESIQALILLTVTLAAIPILENTLGISFEVAILMVTINSMLYLLHQGLGDPINPGWITAAIPITVAHLSNYTIGIERFHALIALQIVLGILFITLGITGLAKKIVAKVPIAIRGGILLGAAISAIFGAANPAGHMSGHYISFIFGSIVSILVLYSARFIRVKDKNVAFKTVAKMGLSAGMISALIVGVMVGEMPMPVIEWGLIPLPFVELISNYTIFALGLPNFYFFVQAVPMAFLVYLISFGDFVLSESVVKEADIIRNDEIVEYNANRSNIICGIRNIGLGIFSPYPPLAGPMWAGASISNFERYKQGREAVDSIHDGVHSFQWTILIAGLLMPVVSLLRPALPIGMALTFIIQGFACGYVAISMLKTRAQQGVATIIGVLIFAQGAAVALIAGIALYLLLGNDEPKDGGED